MESESARLEREVGVDSRTKLIHAVVATPANVADSMVLPDLLHGQETRVWGDQAYRGQRAMIRQRAPNAQDFVNRRYRHRGVVDEVERAKNRTKSEVRARVDIRSGSSSGCSALPSCATAGRRKHSSPARDLRAGQSVHGAPASPAMPTGVVCPQPGRQHRADPNTAPKPPNYLAPSPVRKSRCPPSLHQPLIQTFLRIATYASDVHSVHLPHRAVCAARSNPMADRVRSDASR